MSDFPRMLFRYPATSADTAALQDGKYDIKIVSDQDEMNEAVSDDFYIDHGKARKAQKSTDTKPPTRAELEAEATKWRIKYDGRTGDKKLAELIAAEVG